MFKLIDLLKCNKVKAKLLSCIEREYLSNNTKLKVLKGICFNVSFQHSCKNENTNDIYTKYHLEHIIFIGIVEQNYQVTFSKAKINYFKIIVKVEFGKI